MITLALILAAVILLFSIYKGAPYLPTKYIYVDRALDMMQLERGQLVVDFGCGDGRVVANACKKGYKAIGYEINPFLVLIAKIRTHQYENAEIKWGNMWKKTLPPDTKGVFLFLIPRLMDEMEDKLNNELSGAIVVSYAFSFSSRKPVSDIEPLKAYEF